MKWLAYNAVCLASIGGAIALLVMGIEHGWGWLLLLACMSSVMPASSPKKCPKCGRESA